MKNFKNQHSEKDENLISDVEENQEEVIKQNAEIENTEEAVVEDDIVETLKAENQKLKAFEKHGIKKMEIMGQIFDPNFHQVVQEVEDASKPNGTIIAELQTGYMLNDRILREAMVVVTKGGNHA